jgi:hypothetical protein
VFICAPDSTDSASEGVDTRLKFIVSRTLGNGRSRPRLHLNVGLSVP